MNASRAIKTVQDRKEKERIERERLRLLEIEKRRNILKLDGFKFDEMLKLYEFDQDISISEQELQELTKEGFRYPTDGDGNCDTEKNRGQPKKPGEKPNVLQPRMCRHSRYRYLPRTQLTLRKYKADPLSAPVVEAPKEVAAQQTFKAAFEIDGTKEKNKSIRSRDLKETIK